MVVKSIWMSYISRAEHVGNFSSVISQCLKQISVNIVWCTVNKGVWNQTHTSFNFKHLRAFWNRINGFKAESHALILAIEIIKGERKKRLQGRLVCKTVWALNLRWWYELVLTHPQTEVVQLLRYVKRWMNHTQNIWMIRSKGFRQWLRNSCHNF